METLLIVIGMLWLAAGYQIAELSREVYRKWEKPADNTLATLLGLRVFLFPLNSFNAICRGKKAKWLEVHNGTDGNKQYRTFYTLLNMLYWPIRIAWFLFAAALLFVIWPFALAVIAVTWRVLYGSFWGLLRTMTPSEPTPR